MSAPPFVFRVNLSAWAPSVLGRHITVIVASAPGFRSNVAGPATRRAPSHTSRITPSARFVPMLWAVTRTWTLLFTTGSEANWMSAEEIARSGHVNSVNVRGRMLFRSFVSRIAPPSSTANSGGSTTPDTLRLDSRAPFGCQITDAVTVEFFGGRGVIVSLIQTPAAGEAGGVESIMPAGFPSHL